MNLSNGIAGNTKPWKYQKHFKQEESENPSERQGFARKKKSRNQFIHNTILSKIKWTQSDVFNPVYDITFSHPDTNQVEVNVRFLENQSQVVLTKVIPSADINVTSNDVTLGGNFVWCNPGERGPEIIFTARLCGGAWHVSPSKTWKSEIDPW